MVAAGAGTRAARRPANGSPPTGGLKAGQGTRVAAGVKVNVFQNEEYRL